METIITGLLIGIVSFVIYSLIGNNQNQEKVNYTYEDHLDLLIAICASNVHYGQPPIKVTSLFDNNEIKQNFNSIGHYLLDGKYPKDKTVPNIFDFKIDLESDQKTIKEITISINSDRLADYSGNSSHNDDDSSIEDILFDLEEFTEYDDKIELPIRGINFRNLTEENIGSFDGYIMPDKENKHDKYAIGVYGSGDTHFGFLEKGQRALYNKVEERNGFINAKLEINTFIDRDTGKTRFHGIVTILKDDLL